MPEPDQCPHLSWRQQPDGSLRCEKCGARGRYEWRDGRRIIVAEDEDLETWGLALP